MPAFPDDYRVTSAEIDAEIQRLELALVAWPHVIIRIAAGTPETGIWCGRCLLPSGVRIPFYIITAAGPKRAPHMDFHECTDCGGWI